MKGQLFIWLILPSLAFAQDAKRDSLWLPLQPFIGTWKGEGGGEPDKVSPDKKTIVFITESIENIPAGWRARESYHIISAHEIEEIFELAEPNQDFVLYTKVKLVKQK